MDNKYIVKEQVYASKGKRFVNYLIDRGLFFALFLILGLTLGLIAEYTRDYQFIAILDEMNPILDYLITGVLLAVYYIILEGKYQMSLGKLVTQTVVVDQYGEKPDMSSIVKRSFCRMIPFDHLSFLGNDGRGWHDSISKTYVVDKKILAEKKLLFHELNRIGEE